MEIVDTLMKRERFDVPRVLDFCEGCGGWVYETRTFQDANEAVREFEKYYHEVLEEYIGRHEELCGSVHLWVHTSATSKDGEGGKDVLGEVPNEYGFLPISIIKNLTPDPVSVILKYYRSEEKIYPPSGTVAKVSVNHQKVGQVASSSINYHEVGELTDDDDVICIHAIYEEEPDLIVEGLPEEKVGIYYIVSHEVRKALPLRRDLISPSALVDLEYDGGKVHGGFVRNRRR